MKKNKNRINRYQRKLSHKDNNKWASEYEQEFLRNPEDGPLVTDELFAEIDSLEYFSASQLKKYRGKLARSMKNYQADYEKIEAGLKSYAKSATVHTMELAILTKSLLIAFSNVLFQNYEQSDESIKQMIKPNHFESLTWLDEYKLEPEYLISTKGLHYYQKRADEITTEALHDWFNFMLNKEGDNSLAQSFDELMVQKGVNKTNYYKEQQQSPDILSTYTGLNNFPFFENCLLSSYTVSYDVASKFMSGTLNTKGQRRVFIDGHPEIITGRILSSWIVSPNFVEGQYEILCLPNQYSLYIVWNYHTEIAAGFSLSRNQF